MLCSSYSLLPVYVGKSLYVVYMEIMIHEIKSTQFCSVIFPYKHLYDKNMNVSCNCGPLKVVISVICFSLSYKLSMSVSSV